MDSRRAASTSPQASSLVPSSPSSGDGLDGDPFRKTPPSSPVSRSGSRDALGGDAAFFGAGASGIAAGLRAAAASVGSLRTSGRVAPGSWVAPAPQLRLSESPRPSHHAVSRALDAYIVEGSARAEPTGTDTEEIDVFRTGSEGGGHHAAVGGDIVDDIYR
ncbi:hypothetical protein HDU93_007768 [Gonapodya sp. JEL0774]|nr:hypothetical protein HDU93_007768 [Gonapodya sp. JEL0774]